MKTRKSFVTICIMLIALVTAEFAKADWVTLDAPGALQTLPWAVDGDNLVGYYYDSSTEFVARGFLYDGTTWSTIDAPGARYTYTWGIDGGNIVGWCGGDAVYYAFLYDGANWTTLTAPGKYLVQPMDIDGNNIVGRYNDASGRHGFLYDGITWTTLDFPGASETQAVGIDGSGIVGRYLIDGLWHGFIYDGVVWTSLDFPGAIETDATGIDGGKIVGAYSEGSYFEHGFLYDGTTWTTFDMPGAIWTHPISIDNASIVGYYHDPGGYYRGFLLKIEDPLETLIELLMTLEEVIDTLPTEVFHNKNSARPLINKIDAVLAIMYEGLYEEALDKLKNDILKKTDGCAETGAPDSNDWIITCGAQAEVYPLISSAIDILESLI